MQKFYLLILGCFFGSAMQGMDAHNPKKQNETIIQKAKAMIPEIALAAAAVVTGTVVHEAGHAIAYKVLFDESKPINIGAHHKRNILFETPYIRVVGLNVLVGFIEGDLNDATKSPLKYATVCLAGPLCGIAFNYALIKGIQYADHRKASKSISEALKKTYNDDIRAIDGQYPLLKRTLFSQVITQAGQLLPSYYFHSDGNNLAHCMPEPYQKCYRLLFNYENIRNQFALCAINSWYKPIKTQINKKKLKALDPYSNMLKLSYDDWS